MSEQCTDPFIWNEEEWIFLGAEKVYSLFNPKKYGLKPTAPHTACWKGFIIYFKVTDNLLYFDKLKVNCENNIYPPINGIEPKSDDDNFKVYENINKQLKYSGTIIVGKNMKPAFSGRAFTGPHSYETTFELEFKKGKLVGSKESSGTYEGI